MTRGMTMNRAAISMLIASGFAALVAVFLPTGVAQAATVPIELHAAAGSTTLPGGQTVTVWGYTGGGSPTAPGGPTIYANVNDTVEIELFNDLPGSLNADTGLLVQGQAMVPDRTGVAPGASKVYSFTVDRPGTYLYEAGLLEGAEYQVAMGLYGALVVRPAAGQAYGPSTSFDTESVLVLSEIDPALNTMADPAAFDMRKYAPRYFLMNGVAYPDTATIGAAASDDVLLRYVNAGQQYHSMAVLGARQNLIALDGNPLTYSRDAVAETFGPGQTADTIVTAPPPAEAQTKLAVYDGSLLLHNSNVAGYGGMLTYITIPGTGAAGDTVGPVASAVAFGAGALTATIDDSATGPSNIAAAEYFLDTVGAPGSGSAMTAVSGFDSPTEAVTATFSVPAGQHILYARGQDAAGNWGVFSSVLVNGGDVIGPNTVSAQLTPDHANGTGDVAVSATADDSATGGSAIDAAEYFIDTVGADGAGTAMTVNVAAPIASVDGTITAATIGYPLGGLTEGPHTVYVHSRDASGNWGPAVTLNLVVDRSGPATTDVSVTPNPNNGTMPVNASTPAVRVRATVSDELSVVGAVNSKLVTGEAFIDTVGADGSGIPLAADDGVYDSTSETGYADIPLATVAQLSNGEHTLYVHGKDAAGNWGTTASTILLIDKVNPSVSAIAVSPNPLLAGANVTLTGTGTDGATAITQAEWFRGSDPGLGNGIPMTVTGSGSFSLSATIDTGSWTNGSYTLNVRARDAAGNWSATASTVLVIDRPILDVYFSTAGNGVVAGAGAPYDNADIYRRYNTTNSRVFNASGGAGNAGLPGSANVDAYDRVDNTHYYMSFSGSTAVPGLGTVQDEDVVYFSNGTWSLYFDGSAHGLTANAADIDAITVSGGTLYFSTTGNARPAGVTGSVDNSDVYSWNGASYARVWDATANGIPGSANVDGLSLVNGNHFYLSFQPDTNVSGLGAVQDEDVVEYNNGAWSVYFDGTAAGFTAASQDLDAIDVP